MKTFTSLVLPLGTLRIFFPSIEVDFQLMIVGDFVNRLISHLNQVSLLLLLYIPMVFIYISNKFDHFLRQGGIKKFPYTKGRSPTVSWVATFTSLSLYVGIHSRKMLPYNGLHGSNMWILR